MFCSPYDDRVNHRLMLEGDVNSRDPAKDNRNEDALRIRLQLFQRKEVKLVLVTLPARNTNIYAMIKRAADVHVGIHTICTVAGPQLVEGERFRGIKSSPQFLGNLLLKYNLKLGGINHHLHDHLDGILRKTTMFVGMDVTHPSTGSQNGAPSIAAVVATEEPVHFVNWPVSIRLQSSKEDKLAREVIDDLDIMLKERLDHWMEKNGKLPEQIIFYRDGVSDDFYDLVKTIEFIKMKQAFANFGPQYEPNLVYFIVLKRHSTRFFPSPGIDVTDPSLLDSNANIKPGLLIRDTLTRKPGDAGFFLQSHQSLK
ncbi:MAG: hypothetical protein Q9164_007650, partial [Protoblastenia rupestris]